ncbi:hypothetical protein NE579_03605 [Intestinimonas massiliensis]|uniref:Type 4 fimbrial biogenesis protein PilX N-terminal domain-containing protein n=3 Tax=Intestinimonas TaxID=1392389 RepID=A0AAW5JNV3_9FIRM|nr:hypothetical protein [Intestinimonas massiliensis (ex Afouda et al. 2020)]MCQ4769554.1 hypothetical protein [Intestinimonas massiliensis (ex Afouda et al. 2020)]
MIQTWKKGLASLRNNRGSGVVLVLVCMLFVSILGTTLLYMSYTGFRMKVAERQGKQTFYDASAAMNEIEAGVQKMVTDSIAAAYNTVLVHYSDPSYLVENRADGSMITLTMTQKFQGVFRSLVYAWTYDGTHALIGSEGSAVSPDGLASFLSSPAGLQVTAGAACFERDSLNSSDAGRMVLKDIQVTLDRQPSDTRYTSQVKTDFVIDMPDFYYLTSEYSITGIPQFAVIARTALTQAIGSSTLAIDGSAYAGSVLLSGAGSTFTITNGVMICSKGVDVTDAGRNGSPRLTVDDTVSLWADSVIVNTGGSVSLRGTAYVSDDLALEGRGASASLSGAYFGFGDSTHRADESSAILVNGRDTSLNLSGLNRLTLAGHAFVSDSFFPDSVIGTDVMMGESLAVKSNQHAYLIPAENLEGTSLNPSVTDSAASSVTLDAGKPILGDKFPVDYGISLKHVVIHRGSSFIHYYFMHFSSTAQANRYYMDYFTLHQEELLSDLMLYTTLTDSPMVTQTAGYTIGRRGTDYSLLAPTSNTDYLSSTSAQLKSMFSNLCQTLSPTASASVRDPYEYIVNESAVSSLGSGAVSFRDSSGSMVAVIANGDYSINSSSPSTLKLVLASGSVSVSQDFTGLIISGGTISINNAIVSTVKADEENVAKAFSARDAEGREFRSFLNIDVGSTVEGTSGGSNVWNLDHLVSCRNWSKD